MKHVILAVSGGVDSIVMLHSFVQNDGFADFGEHSSAHAIVATFDHGLRGADSAADARFVEALATKYAIDCEIGVSKNNNKNSEASTRKQRWKFLNNILNRVLVGVRPLPVLQRVGAGDRKGQGTVATAHHQDDLVETVCINVLRGTNRTGLSPLQNSEHIIRPLLHRTKQEIYDYAVQHSLEYVEDTSNSSDAYFRNRIRKYLMPHLRATGGYQKLLQIARDMRAINEDIDSLLQDLLEDRLSQDDSTVSLPRDFLGSLDQSTFAEVVRYALSTLQFPNISAEQYERLFEFVTTKHTGKVFQLGNGFEVHIQKQDFCIKFFANS